MCRAGGNVAPCQLTCTLLLLFPCVALRSKGAAQVFGPAHHTLRSQSRQVTGTKVRPCEQEAPSAAAVTSAIISSGMFWLIWRRHQGGARCSRGGDTGSRPSGNIGGLQNCRTSTAVVWRADGSYAREGTPYPRGRTSPGHMATRQIKRSPLAVRQPQPGPPATRNAHLAYEALIPQPGLLLLQCDAQRDTCIHPAGSRMVRLAGGLSKA